MKKKSSVELQQDKVSMPAVVKDPLEPTSIFSELKEEDTPRNQEVFERELFGKIASLIQIRQFLQESQNNYNIAKKEIGELQGMLILMDRYIANQILSAPFKEVLKFDQAKAATADVRKMNNIKSGL
jgi:hypothetical protein